MTSADPTIQYPDNIQSYNRYSYLNNNPLLAPDLSGYGFEDNKDFLTGVHLVLTGASFCPSACGSVFSLVDSAVYLAEGNGKEASIGLAAAIGGIVTDAGAVKLTIKAADAGLDAVKTAKMGEEAVEATQRIVQTESATSKAVHANSRLSEKAQHLYEIYRTNPDGTTTVVKTGISSGKITKDGESSYRATRQINNWVKEGKAEKGELQQRIMDRVEAGPGAREQALGLEKANADRLRGLNSRNLRNPDFHDRP